MQKTLISFIIIATFVAIPAFAGAQSTPAPVPTGTPAPTSAPVVTSTPAPVVGASVTATAPAVSASVVSVAPTTGSSVTSAAPLTGTSVTSAGVSAPTTGSSVTSAGVTPPSTGTSVTSAGSLPVIPPVVPDGGSSSGSSSGGGRVTFTGGIPASVSTSSCPLITSYMKKGWNNDGVQVVKLQSFLKNSQKLDVDVNGIFDQKTDSAVRAFQMANLQTILGPWGASQSTGVVYITTLKKINQIACAQPLTLSAEELAIIASYRNNRTSGSDDTISTDENSVSGDDVSTTTPVVGIDSNDDENENVAAVGRASILVRFWRFILSLFR